MQRETSRFYMGVQLTKLRLVTPDQTLRIAIYARHSTDGQEGSIERQVADLEKVALRFGKYVGLWFADRGQSATTLYDRPGLTRELLGAAEKKLFDAVLVEHTDRIARKQVDQFWIWEQFKLLGIKVLTPNGEIDTLRLTFESYQNEQFSVNLSNRVKSGQNKAVREGRIPHALGYGYENHGSGQKPKIDAEAQAIVRMFVDARSGMSPRDIAVGLTRDNIPAPKGGAWTFQTVNKILQNEIYIGVYARNKVCRVRNYNTGKRDARPSPDELVRIEVPHLRIVDQDLWDAVQAIRQERSYKYGVKKADRPTISRVSHPFLGLFRCAECGGKMIICGKGREPGDRYITCSASHWRRQCPHSKSYSLLRLSNHAGKRMHAHLTDPDFVNERAAERGKELARMEREASGERVVKQRELDRVNLRIRKLTKLTLDDESEDIPQDIQDEHRELRIQQRGLQQRLALIDAAKPQAPLLASAVKALARDVETLHAMLQKNPNDPACRIALHNLVERVVVYPTGHNEPYDVGVFARHAVYSGAIPIFPHENQGLIRSNSGNAIVPSLSQSVPVLLGRWREAA